MPVARRSVALAVALVLASACSGRARAKSHIALGDAMMERRKVDEAISAYKKAVEESPDFSDAHRSLGIAFFEKGETQPAIDSLTRAISLDPSDPLALAHRGMAYVRASDAARAFADCSGAIKIDPKMPPPSAQLAHSCVCLSGTFTAALEAARAACERAIQINPQRAFPAVYAAAAKLAEAAHDSDAAIIAYEDMIRLAPKVLDAYPRLARLKLEKGERDSAIATLNACFAIDPAYGPAHLLFAELAAKDGKPELASYHLKAASAAGMKIDVELRATIEAIRPDSAGPTK
ncbi:MAG: tetratricopeptide repeat protein [Deltaproteobacteria bacterium]|nr:tetratricopeptide repeat protein [Deltaproteobacteria bacterium]